MSLEDVEQQIESMAARTGPISHNQGRQSGRSRLLEAAATHAVLLDRAHRLHRSGWTGSGSDAGLNARVDTVAAELLRPNCRRCHRRNRRCSNDMVLAASLPTVSAQEPQRNGHPDLHEVRVRSDRQRKRRLPRVRQSILTPPPPVPCSPPLDIRSSIAIIARTTGRQPMPRRAEPPCLVASLPRCLPSPNVRITKDAN